MIGESAPQHGHKTGCPWPQDNPLVALKSSKRAWTEALSLAAELGDKRWASRASGQLGLIAFVEGDTTTAVRLVGRALLSAYQSGDVGAQIEYFSMAGIGFNEEHRFAEGLALFDRAIANAMNTRDAGFPHLAYEGKATALLGLGRPSEARELVLEALAMAQFHNKYHEGSSDPARTRGYRVGGAR